MPNEEFDKMRRKGNSTLSLYACYYTNQIDLATAGKEQADIYGDSAKEMRAVAVELQSFVDESKRKKYRGISVDSISDAASRLIGLSNSFFTPYNCSEISGHRDNRQSAQEIRALLNIRVAK